MSEDDDVITYDYTIENGSLKGRPEYDGKLGKTHILVIEFPEDCDEECFLLALKHYYRAQSQNLKNIEAGIAGH